jgi:hypothetical protein
MGLLGQLKVAVAEVALLIVLELVAERVAHNAQIVPHHDLPPWNSAAIQRFRAALLPGPGSDIQAI